MNTGPTHLICADWSKFPGKRDALVACVASRTLTRLRRRSLDLSVLLDHARDLVATGNAKVLISIDAALGIPRGLNLMAESLQPGPDRISSRLPGFLGWLEQQSRLPGFWEEVCQPEEWNGSRPFIRILPGEGTLTRFSEQGDLHRQIDRKCQGKSPLIVSGIPGVVGGSTRALWQELAPWLSTHAEMGDKDFSIWPFEGSLDELWKSSRIVLAEAYPGISYGIALGKAFPVAKILLNKTRMAARRQAIKQLRQAEWIREHAVTLGSIQRAIATEDYFDALLSCAAQLRCVLEKRRLDDDNGRFPEIEGGILLSGLMDLPTRRGRIAR